MTRPDREMSAWKPDPQPKRHMEPFHCVIIVLAGLALLALAMAWGGV